jgi:arginase
MSDATSLPQGSRVAVVEAGLDDSDAYVASLDGSISEQRRSAVGGTGMGRSFGLIGVPSSMGAFAPGQEKAPAALRAAGLAERLAAAGVATVDHGDAAVRRWRPDRERPEAQNLAAVAEVAAETAVRVGRAVAAGQIPLVLGGDCTVGVGAVAGHLPAAERLALLYFDLHPDLNVPPRSRPGALDWMGLAHLLGELEATPELSRLGPRFPLLAPEQVLLFAVGPEQATPWEQAAIERLGLRVVPVDAVGADPEAAAAAALVSLEPRCDRLLVHFDVDVVDFTDLPLSEETGRNQGLPFAAAMRALGVLLASPKLGALTITELNPDHGAADGSTVTTFVDALVGALAGTEFSA